MEGHPLFVPSRLRVRPFGLNHRRTTARFHPVPSPISVPFTHLLPGTTSGGFRRQHGLLPIGSYTPGRSHQHRPRLLRILGRFPDQPFRVNGVQW